MAKSQSMTFQQMAGVQTNTFRTNLNDVEKEMVKNVKQYYGFRTDREMFLALLKKAHLHINK